MADAPHTNDRAMLWLEGSGGAKLRGDSPRSYTELAAAGMDEQVGLERTTASCHTDDSHSNFDRFLARLAQ